MAVGSIDWEWCWDWYSSYAETAQTDPSGTGDGYTRLDVSIRAYDGQDEGSEVRGLRAVRLAKANGCSAEARGPSMGRLAFRIGLADPLNR